MPQIANTTLFLLLLVSVEFSQAPLDRLQDWCHLPLPQQVCQICVQHFRVALSQDLQENQILSDLVKNQHLSQLPMQSILASKSHALNSLRIHQSLGRLYLRLDFISSFDPSPIYRLMPPLVLFVSKPPLQFLCSRTDLI